MKRPLKLMLVLGVLTACFVLQSSFGGPSTDPVKGTLLNDEISKKELLNLLDMKCRVCQQIKEPFMVLKNSNALYGAVKIYSIVFQESKNQRERQLN